MKIVIFGTGGFYDNRKNIISKKHKIVAFLDNDSSKWGKQKENIPIISLNNIREIEYDAIVVMLTKVEEVYKQLIEYGIDSSKILFFEDVLERDYNFFNMVKSNRFENNSVLIVFTSLCYDGGTMAICNMAFALKMAGYEVSILAYDALDDIKELVKKKGVRLFVCRSLNKMNVDDFDWIKQYI
ncbi:MAG: hypothetical protein Q4E99_06790, partial [Bacillota bacterium]|nr:hypothetical protein [Bacillota bacterium]